MRKTLFVTLLVCATIVVPIAARAQSSTQPKVIEITAKRFAFSPDNLTLKKGEPVVLRLTTADVTHGFFSREIKVDELIEPGKPVQVTVTPQKAGTFTVICHHFCGAGHGNMKMTVTVVE
ncbi:MAG TPA: cupredoxin domain-containing protein [Terriglobales bacterium]|nr:cupredoxin domain-containing protein [Terriglobales bacterium]